MMRSTETNMRLSRSAAAAVRLLVSFAVIIVSMSPNNETLASPYGAYDLFIEDLLLERSKNGDANLPETQPVVAGDSNTPAETNVAAVESKPDPTSAKKANFPSGMMTLTEWNNYMFRRNNNNFAVQPVHHAVWDYNPLRMMLQQPYNYQMMGLNRLQWGHQNNLYGLVYWPI